MKVIIETERLLLREFQLGDAEKMYQLNLDPDVIKYTGDGSFNSINEAKYFLSNYKEYKKNKFGRWAVLLKSNNDFIGWCGLKLNEENMIDLGFRFFQKYWNKGFASEAALSCLEYGFNILNIDTVVGRSLNKNLTSIKVLDKIGMKFWKSSLCHENEKYVYYKISNQEFKSI